jgi:adenylyltransferase/sulfurtransferase
VRASSALVVGAGGLGCPAALYLAACGVGRLILADPDRVDLTNLQRQILYGGDAVGARKVVAANTALKALNTEVDIETVPERLAGAALEALVARAGVVLDCSDNYATRHSLNRACARHARPLVSGAAIRFDAQLAVFDLRVPESPCYACLYPEDGKAEEVQCSQMGVFAPLTGVVGALQAMEAVKLLARVGTPFSGRLLLLEALGPEWRTVRVRRDPACPVCRTERR